MDKKAKIKKQIEIVLNNKNEVLNNAYSKSLEQLVEDLKIYQYELEFQNDELIKIQVDLENVKNEYEQLFQHAPVGYLVLNEHLQILECNQTFRSIISYSSECQKQMDFRLFIAPDFQDKFHFFARDIIKQNNANQIEIPLLTQDNNPKYVSIYGNLFTKDNVARIRLTITDINDRILAQNALKKNEEELRTINENMTDMIAVSDLNGNIKYASPSCKILGYSQEEMLNFSIFDMVHPEDISTTLERFQKAIISESADSLEFRALTKSGNYIWVDTAGNIIYNKNGEIDRAVFVVRDISDRKNIEEQLAKTSEILHQTSQLARIGGWELDLVSNTLYWSKVTAEIHEVPPGFQPDLETGINFYLEGHHRELIKKRVDSAIYSGESFDDELQIITAKGNVKWVRAMGSPELKNGLCVRIYGVFQDIEDKHKIDEILKNNEKRLQELNKTKDIFFSIIAHDLKSPFNSIIGFSEVLTEQIKEKNYEGIEEYAELICGSSKRAMDLLLNILEWSRLQTDRIGFVPIIQDLNDLVDSAINLLSGAASQKSMLIQKDIPKGILINADKAMIETVFRNLISNAIKFTPSGGKILVSTKVDADNFIISVSDNGIGINENDIQKLFRIDECLSTYGTENERGTGLGLILCKEFVEKHGGKIWLESEVGIGSTFFFTLPKLIKD